MTQRLILPRGHALRRPPVNAALVLSLQAGLLLGAALYSLTAVAQSCASLPPAGELPPPRAEKFALIASHCPLLGEAAAPRRARQLDLYSPTLRLGETAAPAPLPTAAPPARLAPVRLPALPEQGPDRVKAPKWEPMPQAPSTQPLDRAGQRVVALAPTLLEAARAQGLDPLLLHAIAHVESRHDASAVSHAGARGVMQVMPATAARLGVAQPERSLHEPATNVRASAELLRRLMARYPDRLDLVLAAYNAGEGAVERHGRRVPPFAETQDYVRKVAAVYERLNQEFVVDQQGRLILREAPGDLAPSVSPHSTANTSRVALRTGAAS